MRRVFLKALLFLLIFTGGYLTHHFFARQSLAKTETDTRKQRRPVGFWFNTARVETNNDSIPSEEEMAKLAALGYVDGVQKPTRKKGVFIHDAALIQPGLNYYTSGHGPEAFLMKTTGEIMHRWKMRFDRAFPDASATRRKALGARYWRSVHVFENGDLLAIYEAVGLVKLDKHSRLLWKYNGNPHHDLDVQPDGTIYVLTRKPRIVPSRNDGKAIWEDFITVLDSNGKQLRSISILKALQDSIYISALNSKEDTTESDLFHTNTVEVLDGSLEREIPFLKKGNILVSLCFLDMVAVVDPVAGKIVWALSKMWSKQHAPVFLQNGDLMVYDNRGGHGRSRVLQIRPLTQDAVWVYETAGFYSEILGYAQRLKNGNTLITDSDDGRAFEVTPGKKIVWEFYNPKRAGRNQEFVAVLPEMTRLDSDFDLQWLP